MPDDYRPLVEPLGDTAEPAEVCARLLDLPYIVFLDSAALPWIPDTRAAEDVTSGQASLQQYSFLTADPVSLVRSKGRLTEIWRRGETQWSQAAGDALQVARTLLPRQPVAPVPGLPPFQGGLAGYIGYDWGGVLERLPRHRYDDLGVPDVVLGLYDWVIAWDHRIGTAWLISTGLPETGVAASRQAQSRMEMVRARLGAHSTGALPAEAETVPVLARAGGSTPTYR